MDELTMDDLQLVEDTQAAPPALIQVAQLPIIIQHLEIKAAEVAEKTRQAMSLAVSPETLVDVKKVRADLNKDLDELEAQRKAVKNAVMAPYEDFEAIYRRCIKIPFENANRDLGSKILDVEQGIIGACRDELIAFFTEQAEGEGIPWLTWDRLGLRITLTEARQKTHPKLEKTIRDFIAMKAAAVRSISTMPDAEEIMVEFKKSMSMADAVQTVAERHKQMEAERKRRAEWEAKQAADREAAEKAHAAAAAAASAHVAAPAPAPVTAPAAPEKVYKLNFSVRGTKAQLVDFKKFFVAYCEERGLSYE